eukprot:CAMPEP_0113471146 /NCGR_PEP_ID=MMETSP0014_2-20120614/16827_1 /TAXON_ID=2857 /ORGANISM="Nitzschia sp." /LENGTH=257 /DNA_ID=CAMNT_0000363771 /DNA_START=120 /DNA_END=893 /DNA_ORIENTATION=- /assembly_acc=CAM_ASM_000159
MTITPKVGWLALCNICVAASWLNVFGLIVTHLSELELAVATTDTALDADAATAAATDEVDSFCESQLRPAVFMALMISFVEVVNCLLGFTKSPLPAVLLFSCTRYGVEQFIGSKIPCTCWQHLLTVACWSLGDTIRFSSLAIVTLAASSTSTSTTTGKNSTDSNSSTSSSLSDKISYVAKSIRFTVGPILFPIGASGEMFMVILAGSATTTSNTLWYYGAAALWPVFFYPMMVQLLKQRRRHFSSGTKPKKKQIKKV